MDVEVLLAAHGLPSFDSPSQSKIIFFWTTVCTTFLLLHVGALRLSAWLFRTDPAKRNHVLLTTCLGTAFSISYCWILFHYFEQLESILSVLLYAGIALGGGLVFGLSRWWVTSSTLPAAGFAIATIATNVLMLRIVAFGFWSYIVWLLVGQ